METKFTSGPWTLGDENNQCCDINCGETVISLSRYPLNGDCFVIERDEMLANAKLIIAAPELYEALENINKAIDAYWNSDDDDEDSLIKEIMRWQQISLAALNKVG
jgi:hypothetical protein